MFDLRVPSTQRMAKEIEKIQHTLAREQVYVILSITVLQNLPHPIMIVKTKIARYFIITQHDKNYCKNAIR